MRKFMTVAFECVVSALCRHDWHLGEKVIEGATMTWLGHVTRQCGWHYTCKKCGATKYEGGFYVLGDRKRYPGAYNADGWPINEDGKKLPIAH